MGTPLNVLLYLPEGMADWEVGYASAELSGGQFLRPERQVFLSTASAGGGPIRTMGGMTVVPDTALADTAGEQIDALILPGGTSWDSAANVEVLDLASQLKDRGAPVAAICGAVDALAGAGLLNDVAHTGNSADSLAAHEGYSGSALYREELTVSDRRVVTAGSWAPVEFAAEIFRTLDVMDQETLGSWLLFWGKRDVRGIYQLMEAQAE
ncbi:DJ-1/PfpI family protein [Arthrobacter zhaoguopingii]|uniref:DJ-1/PfpI family protein n=1 Tax=Arthrobacter zhaoguopingii TaxID=2681491 RepID=UPI0013572C06|nr:DJ-1/PfpI family protein [Arthrobacter zhaoguopingii]